MSTAELIYRKVKSLPEERQAEILDFVEFLGLKAGIGDATSEGDWSFFSLAAALRGMESEDGPEFTLEDLKERFG